MSKFVFNENMYGRKVKFLSDEAHIDMPEFYPAVGTVGSVVEFYDNYMQKKDWKVQWPKGSTSGDDCWFCDEENVELIEEVDKQMTNEEIWEMLENKMRKNGLKIAGYLKDYIGETACYDEFDVHNAIALAYKAGYLRAMKGRPFKIGEKKKKGGHWEPVDPNNLPKEGTRVKYTRECKDYKNEITLGSTGIVRIKGPKHDWFGMSLDDYEGMYSKWLSFDGLTAKSLDMWVEDDE